MLRPRVAFFDFASCGGCQLSVINLEEKLIDLVELVDIVSFRAVMKEHSDDYDIAFVEGSIARPIDNEQLRFIRDRAKILVALGACACIGGINALRNRFTIEDVKKTVYANDPNINDNPYFDIFSVKAVDDVVKVDYYIPGCPADNREIVHVITALVLGKRFELPNYPVCVECKKNGNVCVFELGIFCLGPVVRASCNAVCPTESNSCIGCRGLLDNPNIEAEFEVLQKYGLKLDDALNLFNMFCSKAEVS